MTTSNNFRHVELSWAGRVRTCNRQSFDCMKDAEATCRFKEPLLRESIYKKSQRQSGLSLEL